MQRALRRPGRAGRVDQQCRILRRRRHGIEVSGSPARSCGNPARVRRRLLDADDVREAGQGPHAEHSIEAVGVRDRDADARVAQPVLQRLMAEQRRERQHDGPELVDREMEHGELRALRQDEPDPVAAIDAQASKARASWLERARNSANVCSLTRPASSS